MGIESILFYLLAGLLVGFSVATVTARNPVRSAVYLISSLLAMAGLFFLLNAEFVGAVQILVYVGGIMVLFLFVIMLISVREEESGPRADRQWKAALGVVIVLGLLIVVLMVQGVGFLEPPTVSSPGEGNTESVGKLLYGRYMLPFEIASVLLLVAMVGAVVMARREL